MTIRGDILQEAKDLTEGERNKEHGDPLPNMQCFAGLVSAYLRGLWPGLDVPELDGADGAAILVLHKTSRLAANKRHRDNPRDGAAYFSIAGECAQREAE